MKKIILILALISIATASQFCVGFNAGYKAGYCYQKYTCLEPLPPLCPLPGLGERTWSDGYNRGFMLGIAKR